VATTRPLSELLPKEMTELRARPLFSLLLEVQPPIVVGKTPALDRRIGIISGGRFEGERLRGTLLPGGSDWQTVRGGDGAWLINVRIVLKTDDDAIIGMPYTGIRHGPKEVLDRIGTAGSTTSSASASVTGCLRGRSIRCSRSSSGGPQPAGAQRNAGMTEGLGAGAGFRFAHLGCEASLHRRNAACASCPPGAGRRKRVC
jgi:hypothetical protein